VNGIGADLGRPDALAKVAGEFTFLTDRRLAGCAWAVVVRSPHPHARVVSIGAADGPAVPGTIGIFGPADLPGTRFNSALVAPDPALAQAVGRRLLTSVARHVGDGIAVVVAGSRSAARDAARRMPVRWEVLPAMLSIDEALARGAIAGKVSLGDERVTRLLDGCPVTVAQTFTFDAAQHVCLEPHACAAIPFASGVELWTNAQCPAEVRRLVADILGLDRQSVRVRKNDEGGGFGAKQDLYEEALVAWLALRLGRPVRLTYTRQEEFTAGRVRSAGQISLRMGFDQVGRMVATDMHAVLNAGAYVSHTPYVLNCLAGHLIAVYPHAAHRFAGVAVRTNTVPAGAYRGYGVAEAAFAVEQLMDVAADRLGLSPLEIRKRNVRRHPRRPGLAGCLEHLPPPGPPRQAGHLAYGTGMAVAAKHSITSGANPDSSRALVLVEPGPKVTLLTGTCDSGTGSSTALRQIVASELGIHASEVLVVEGDTGAGVTDLGSTAQRSVFVGGQAARAAAAGAARRLLLAAARMTGRDAADLSLRWPSVVLTRTGEPVAEVSDAARAADAGSFTDVRAVGRGASYAAVQVTVTVDRETGEIRVRSVHAVVDCGTVVNPQGARGQVAGGLVQGMGLACMDQWRPGPAGHGPQDILTHAVPTATDAPDIGVQFLPPGWAAPWGGLGELPVVPIGPAIANAVSNATGIRCCHTPIRPAEAWGLLAGCAGPHGQDAHGQDAAGPDGRAS
jgi:putative selenate reductase molybdopterin-binding subunit